MLSSDKIDERAKMWAAETSSHVLLYVPFSPPFLLNHSSELQLHSIIFDVYALSPELSFI